jgi:hypothetical protein
MFRFSRCGADLPFDLAAFVNHRQSRSKRLEMPAAHVDSYAHNGHLGREPATKDAGRAKQVRTSRISLDRHKPRLAQCQWDWTREPCDVEHTDEAVQWLVNWLRTRKVLASGLFYFLSSNFTRGGAWRTNLSLLWPIRRSHGLCSHFGLEDTDSAL